MRASLYKTRSVFDSVFLLVFPKCIFRNANLNGKLSPLACWANWADLDSLQRCYHRVTLLICFYFVIHKQAIEEEGGDPDQIVLIPDSNPKKSAPKRTAKGKTAARSAAS